MMLYFSPQNAVFIVNIAQLKKDGEPALYECAICEITLRTDLDLPKHYLRHQLS
jgi:hypothetical protein